MATTKNSDPIHVKPSAGFVMAQTMSIQGLFLIYVLVLIFTGAEADSITQIGGTRISELDVALILLGIVVQASCTLLLRARWQKTEYVIGSRDLEITKGIFMHDKESVELSNITTCHAHQSMVGKLHGFGSVTIKLRFQEEPIVLEGVPFPDEFISQMHARIGKPTE